MSNRTITTNDLKPGDSFLVKGTLGYSRLVKQIAGKALEEDKISRRQRRIPEIDVPYTTATIHNAQVIVKDGKNIQPIEKYAMESLYVSKSESAEGYSFTGNNKGKFLPWIGQEKENKVVEQAYPQGELASGLSVTLVMRIFKASQNNGVTLDGIIVHEPIRLYSAGNTSEIMNQHGYQFVPTQAPVVEDVKEEVKEDVQEEFVDPYGQEIQMNDNAPDPRIAQAVVQPSTQQGTMPPNPLAGAQPQQAPTQPAGIRYDPNQRY